MKKTILLILLSVFFLSGCATKWDVGLNNGYNDAEINGQNQSAKVVASQTDGAVAIAKNFKGKTDTENALMAVIAIDRVTRIEAPQYHVKAPRLNTDNFKAGADVITGGIPIFGMGYVSKVALEQPRSNSLVTGEGDIIVSDSMNSTTTHTTSAGESSATSNLNGSEDGMY